MWLLSDKRMAYHPEQLPYLVHLAVPILAIITVALVSPIAKKANGRALWASAALAAAVTYVMLLSPKNEHYRLLMVPHLPLLRWSAVGFSVIGPAHPRETSLRS